MEEEEEEDQWQQRQARIARERARAAANVLRAPPIAEIFRLQFRGMHPHSAVDLLIWPPNY